MGCLLNNDEIFVQCLRKNPIDFSCYNKVSKNTHPVRNTVSGQYGSISEVMNIAG